MTCPRFSNREMISPMRPRWLRAGSAFRLAVPLDLKTQESRKSWDKSTHLDAVRLDSNESTDNSELHRHVVPLCSPPLVGLPSVLTSARWTCFQFFLVLLYTCGIDEVGLVFWR